MDKVVNCLGHTLDLSQIATVHAVNKFHVPDWFFIVVLASGERIKISENHSTNIDYERQLLVDQWDSYQNSEGANNG